MSTSELRRGPGWWMDLDGQWNPPELWPEASPPLPGWIRAADGNWHAPATDDDSAVQTTPVSNDQTNAIASLDTSAPAVDSTPQQRPVPETMRYMRPAAAQSSEPEMPAPKSLNLEFSEVEFFVQPEFDEERMRKRAIVAALVSAVLAIAIAAIIVTLLALL